MTETIFEKSQSEQSAYSLPKSSSLFAHLAPPEALLRKTPLHIPEVSELDLTRHFIGLSRRNVGIDNIFYPLGSCTMKFNPRINEEVARIPFFSKTHPLAPDRLVQGNLRVISELLSFLSELTGMSGGSLLPNAGAQGELTGVKMIAAYHRKRGDLGRVEFLVPDSAHGTNPATVTMSGFQVKPVGTDKNGDIDLKQLEAAVSEKTAGLMLTNPNTLGLFSPRIEEIARVVHSAGGLLYYDGANLNPILTIAKPGEMGFDVMHLNLHKTFSTPHGGGGPGSGPVLCNDLLKEFLPVPKVLNEGGVFKTIWDDKESIGGMVSFHGNFGIYLRALAYAKLHGFFGMRRIAENAVLNANYLKSCLSEKFCIPYPQPCMHEFVLQADLFLSQNIRGLDIAKRLLDYGVHAPTVYFPLIIKECFLIEPTESESKRTLDHFIETMKAIVSEAENSPELILDAPHTMPVRRLDETRAAKTPILIDPLVSKRMATNG